MSIETILTPATGDDAIRLILAAITFVLTPAWIMYSKHRLQRSGIIDLLNSFTTSSNATALLVVPVQRFFAFDAVVSITICAALTALMYRYLGTSTSIVYKNLQSDIRIEYPEFSEFETGETA